MTGSTWVHRCLIVPDKHVVLARTLTAVLAGESGSGMWTAALSADGNLPATYWISAGMVTEEFANLLPCNDIGKDGDAETTVKLAFACGMSTTKEKVQELFDKSFCTTEEAVVALQRLKLKLIE